MSDPSHALDDVADGDQFAGALVPDEHDLDIAGFDEEGAGDE